MTSLLFFGNDRLTNQLTNQPTGQPTNWPANHLANRLTNHPTNTRTWGFINVLTKQIRLTNADKPIYRGVSSPNLILSTWIDWSASLPTSPAPSSAPPTGPAPPSRSPAPGAAGPPFQGGNLGCWAPRTALTETKLYLVSVKKKKTYTYSSYKTFINKEDPKACRLGYREEVRYEDSYVCKNKLREFRN